MLSLCFVIQWIWEQVYDSTQPSWYPYPQYLAVFDDACIRTTAGDCQHGSLTGGPYLFLSQGQTYPWIGQIDNVNILCCDGSWKPDRYACGDCSAKNYLPLILGLTLGFVGLCLCIVGCWVITHVRRKRRLNPLSINAGHKAPPKSLHGAFPEENHHPHPHHPTTELDLAAMVQRPDHVAHAPPGTVVVKVTANDSNGHHHHHHHKKDEPDHTSTPEAEHHHKHDKHRRGSK